MAKLERAGFAETPFATGASIGGGGFIPGRPAPVPAPAPIFLLGGGLVTLAALRAHRRR